MVLLSVFSTASSSSIVVWGEKQRMGAKRKKSEMEDSVGGETSSDKKNMESSNKKRREILPSMIKNKEKRSAVHAKLKQQKKLEKRKKIKARDAAEKRALELGEEVSSLTLLSRLICCEFPEQFVLFN